MMLPFFLHYYGSRHTILNDACEPRPRCLMVPDYRPNLLMDALIGQVCMYGLGWDFERDGNPYVHTPDEIDQILSRISGHAPSPEGEGDDDHGASSPEPPEFPEPFVRGGRLRESPRRKRWSSTYVTKF